jgi:hypothetical protein
MLVLMVLFSADWEAYLCFDGALVNGLATGQIPNEI